jgi:hypothetical protein
MKVEESKLREGGWSVMRGGLRYRTHQFGGLIHNTLESAYLSGGVLLMLLAVLVLYLALLTDKAY